MQAAITADSRQYNVFTFLEDDANLSDGDDEENDNKSGAAQEPSTRPHNNKVTSAVDGQFGTRPQQQTTASSATAESDGNGNEPPPFQMRLSLKGERSIEHLSVCVVYIELQYSIYSIYFFCPSVSS